MQLTLQFLGVGSASQEGLGHAAALLELPSAKLLIDCGPGTLKLFAARHPGCLPDAVFITHCHLDHIGDFENFFIQAWFASDRSYRPKIFVPASIVAILHERVANYPMALAEGGVNFWDAFQLIPVTDKFFFDGIEFNLHAVRHHAPNTAFGLHVKGAFFYTGDTRPIPEILTTCLTANETIFHDCGVIGNPSHTGIDDLAREYSQALIARMVFYHYRNAGEQAEYTQRSLEVALPGQVFSFELSDTVFVPQNA